MFYRRLSALSLRQQSSVNIAISKRFGGGGHGPEGYEPAGYLFGRPVSLLIFFLLHSADHGFFYSS